MTNERFQELLNTRLALIQSVLATKGAEYATDDDRMHNFNVARKISPTTISREEAIFGMTSKHLVSVLDIIEGTRYSKKFTEGFIREKFGDLINYLILMETSLMETSLVQNPDDDLPF